MKDNFDPTGQSKPWYAGLAESRLGKHLFNNRGEIPVTPPVEPPAEPPAAPVEPPAEPPAAPPADDWKQNLDESIRAHPALEKFKNPYDVAKSYVEVQPLIGKEKIPVPGKDSDPTTEQGAKEWDAVYDRLGRPSDPKDYSLPDVQFPENFPKPTDETISEFKALGHKVGLLPHQMAALYEWDSSRGIETVAQQNKQVEAANQQAETDLRKEYGVAYDANLNAAQMLVDKAGGQELKDLLNSSGMGADTRFIKFAVKLAKGFSEDNDAFGGAPSGSILTPSEAMSEISKIRADKEHPYHAHNKDNPEHKTAVGRMAQLFQMAHPTQK